MMYTGSDEDILGLDEEAEGISAEIEHRFTVKEPTERKDTFVATEPKKKSAPIVIVKGKNNGKKSKSGKTSNLF